MIHPIYLLGTASLRKPTIQVDKSTPEFETLLSDMVETMHDARGIGLAAPQIGKEERVFVVDVSPMEEDFIESGTPMPEQPMFFINPHILEETGDDEEFEEGCLSIPDIQEIVVRPNTVTIQYQDRDFVQKTETFDGILARVIQHEYDHVEAVLFIDHLTAFKRRLLKRRLNEIQAGNTEAEYAVYTDERGIIYPQETE